MAWLLDQAVGENPKRKKQHLLESECGQPHWGAGDGRCGARVARTASPARWLRVGLSSPSLPGPCSWPLCSSSQTLISGLAVCASV